MRIIDRWRISRCLEEGRELPAGLDRRVRQSAELSRYCSGLERVERSLRESARLEEFAAPGMAEDVLARIRSEGARAPEPHRAWTGRWPLVVSGLAACAVIAGVSLLMVRPALPVKPANVPAGPGWRVSAALPRTPVEEPLVREARLLAQDTRRAADMVLASFPSARPSR